jgi:valyl-tRNA synthetase
VGKLYFIKYGPVTVATTRPETKLGDTALAVHPDDERYRSLVGQEFEVALGKVKVYVKVIADKSIDQSFGTGVVGVTPAHSMADFELAQKNKLPLRIIIDQAGKMTAEAGEEYSGLKIKEARAKFIADLGPQVEKIEDYKHNLSICYRCGMPVEPMPLEQWFVAVDKPFKVGWFHKSTLKKLALKAVRSGQIRIVPDKFDKTYFQWMENLHDWCISRQIWFGHRIPAWRCLVCGGWHVTAQEPVKLILSRHGLTDWNEIGRIQGTTEVPLDESEIKQTEDIAKNFVADHPAIVITSPLMRARQTAAIFAEHLKCEVVEDDRIHERHYGVFEGKMVDDLVKDNPDYSEHKLSYPISGAETYAEVAARLKPFLADLAARYPGKTVVVVAHNAVLRTFRLLLDNMVDPELSHYRPALNEPLRREIVEPCACGSWALRQDEDTLDTWFSSSLWTFSTLGWPKQTKDLQNFHPTSVMETGYDILFFWVARMILMTSYVLKQVPFKTVYLHGLVRDKEGRKMSKSLGNGIDPLLMIEKYGADALRLAMIIGTTPGNDFRLYEEKISGYRNFVNKLWNIVRFALLSIANPRLVDQPPLAKTLADKWILSRFRTVADLVTAKVADFQFSEAGEALYDFTWHELADWYLEIAKLEGDKDDILCYLLTQLLKLWHPYTPFVTEVLWREAFGAAAGLLMVQPWPNQLSSKDDKAEEEFAQVRAVVTVLRNFRVERKVPSADVLSIALVKDSGVLQAQTKLIEGLRTKVKIMSQAEADWLEVKGLEQVSEHDLSIRIKF